MAHRGNVLSQKVIVGTALAPQSVNAATVTGPAIVEPWRYGRQIAFLLSAGTTLGAATTYVVKLQGLSRSDGTTWVDLTLGTGVGVLAFLASRLAKTGGVWEGNVLIGTVNLDDINGTLYSAIRISLQNEVAAASLVQCTYVISDLNAEPTGIYDELYGLARTGTQQ